MKKNTKAAFPPERMQINVMVRCTDQRIKDCRDGVPDQTLVSFGPQQSPGRPYNHVTNCPRVKQVWYISINNMDDALMSKAYDNCYDAADDFALIVAGRDLKTEWLEAAGFRWE